MVPKIVHAAGVAFAVSAFVTVLAAPAAHATTTISVAAKNSTQVVQGCGATLTATTTTSNPMSIEFYDNLTLLGKVFVTNQQGKMQASIDWTPADAGEHVITARGIGAYVAPEDLVNTALVRVSAGINLGSACIPLG
jgi:hypothetical protein